MKICKRRNIVLTKHLMSFIFYTIPFKLELHTFIMSK